ncbi:MAG: hypothetical protein IJV76_06055 [Clostridia bacterium]|nr:hypothetical protein [Clostridia bacterium]
MTLAYCLNDFDEVDIFFWVDEGTDEMEDLEILCFPIETFDEDRAEFEAVCDYCEMVAIVALDKLYGKQNNPMRKDGIRILAEDIAEGIRMRRATSGS